jgi:hypothetical protein
VTPSPTDSTTPAPSWPRTMGNAPSGSLPERVYASTRTSAQNSYLFPTHRSYQYDKHPCNISRSALRGPLAGQPRSLQWSILDQLPKQPPPMRVVRESLRYCPSLGITLQVMVCQTYMLAYDVKLFVKLNLLSLHAQTLSHRRWAWHPSWLFVNEQRSLELSSYTGGSLPGNYFVDQVRNIA